MISFRSFTKRYGRQTAVESLALEVQEGEALALLGPNGSGKTTSLKGAAGLIHPTAGEVLLGRPGRRASDPEAREVLFGDVVCHVLGTAREVCTRTRGRGSTAAADSSAMPRWRWPRFPIAEDGRRPQSSSPSSSTNAPFGGGAPLCVSSQICRAMPGA